jgi:agmatine/peptidylarginine deiminase
MVAWVEQGWDAMANVCKRSPGTTHSWPSWLPFLLFPFLFPSPGSRAQSTPAPAQHPASDVVILSLEALDPRAENRRHAREGLLGNSGAALSSEEHLLDMQMNIVRETARFGPVLLLAPDENTKNVLVQRCPEFQICELLRNDQIRLKVVAHDGVWIRDFGPQIEAVGDAAYVVHWRYFDIRADQAKQEKVRELEIARLKLIETREQQDQPDALAQESTPDAHKAVISAIDDKLYLLREYSQILNEASLQRSNDENSAYDIADAVLATPDFKYKHSEVALDGGNLLKLEDGRCLTTRALLSRNKDQSIPVDAELEKVGGCKNVTYLDPLPGPVIEHIDMFVLPAGGKRILLASYDLSKPFAREYWGKLSNSERDLAVNAEVTMEWDAERLRHLGYEVVPVPSPFPRIPAKGHTYYPTMLNALVREGLDGYRQVVVPAYKDYETDIQSRALEQIGAAFGPKAEIVSIEATEAAKSQGAVHCLTLTAPLPLSIFGDSGDAARRSENLAQREQLDGQLSAQLAAEIPTTGLQGLWAILDKEEPGDSTPLELYPQRIFFAENEFQKGVFDQLESVGTYTIDTRDLPSWSLHFEFPNKNVVPAVVQWVSKDEVKLILGDGNSRLLLRRIGSDRVSPFHVGEKVSPQSGEAGGLAGKKPSGREKPATSTGAGTVGLQAVQP